MSTGLTVHCTVYIWLLQGDHAKQGEGETLHNNFSQTLLKDHLTVVDVSMDPLNNSQFTCRPPSSPSTASSSGRTGPSLFSKSTSSTVKTPTRVRHISVRVLQSSKILSISCHYPIQPYSENRCQGRVLALEIPAPRPRNPRPKAQKSRHHCPGPHLFSRNPQSRAQTSRYSGLHIPKATVLLYSSNLKGQCPFSSLRNTFVSDWASFSGQPCFSYRGELQKKRMYPFLFCYCPAYWGYLEIPFRPYSTRAVPRSALRLCGETS